MSPETTNKQAILTKFNGKNFQVWKHKTSVDLQAHDKDELWSVVETGVDLLIEELKEEEAERRARGVCDTLETLEKMEKKIKALKKLDKIALSELNRRIEDTYIFMIKDCKSAKECWMKLCEQHEKRGLANRLFIRRKFFGLRWDGNSDLQKYMSMFLQTADELRSASVKLGEDEMVEIFLSSLHESYDSLIVALETKDGITWDYVTARVLHEEKKRRESMRKDNQESALLHQGPSHKNGKKKAFPKKKNSKGKGKGPHGGCFICGEDHYACDYPERGDKKHKEEESN